MFSAGRPLLPLLKHHPQRVMSVRQRRAHGQKNDSDDDVLDSEYLASSSRESATRWLFIIAILVMINLLLGYAHFLRRANKAVTADSFSQPEESRLVKKLTDETLPGHIAGHPNGTLVNFHMKDCKHCNKLASEFEEAAQKLQYLCDTSLVNVDASDAPLALMRYGVTRFPAMLWFRRGELLKDVPPAVRTTAKILEFVDASLQSAVIDFLNRDDFDEAVPQLRSVLQGESLPVIVGFGREPAVYEALSQAGEKFRGATAFLFVRESRPHDPFIRAYYRNETGDQVYNASLGLQDVQNWLQPIMDSKGKKRAASSS